MTMTHKSWWAFMLLVLWVLVATGQATGGDGAPASQPAAGPESFEFTPPDFMDRLRKIRSEYSSAVGQYLAITAWEESSPSRVQWRRWFGKYKKRLVAENADVQLWHSVQQGLVPPPEKRNWLADSHGFRLNSHAALGILWELGNDCVWRGAHCLRLRRMLWQDLEQRMETYLAWMEKCYGNSTRTTRLKMRAAWAVAAWERVGGTASSASDKGGGNGREQRPLGNATESTPQESKSAQRDGEAVGGNDEGDVGFLEGIADIFDAIAREAERARTEEAKKVEVVNWHSKKSGDKYLVMGEVQNTHTEPAIAFSILVFVQGVRDGRPLDVHDARFDIALNPGQKSPFTVAVPVKPGTHFEVISLGYFEQSPE